MPSWFNREKRRQRKLYQQRLDELREKFQSAMQTETLREALQGNVLVTSVLELWGVAFLIDETVALKTLTKVLIALTIVLGGLTFILAYPIISPILFPKK